MPLGDEQNTWILATYPNHKGKWCYFLLSITDMVQQQSLQILETLQNKLMLSDFCLIRFRNQGELFWRQKNADVRKLSMWFHERKITLD